MRCHLREIKGNWHASFDFAGTAYTASLKTKVEREAKARIGLIRNTLYQLEIGAVQVPPDADPKTFIVSGGKLKNKVEAKPAITLGALIDIYLKSRKVEPNTLKTLEFHFAHVKRLLGPSTRVEGVRLREAQRYADVRAQETHHGRHIRPYTIRKELSSLRRALSWAAERGHVENAPAWRVGAIDIGKDPGREPFRTFDQIRAKIDREKPDKKAEAAIWETLYLESQELVALLDHVEAVAVRPWIYPFIATVALTGCRRSEAARSLIEDWNLDENRVVIREKKADRSKSFTFREIDIHPRLAETMGRWFENHPGGGHAFADETGSPITLDQATDHFKRTMRGHEKWSKVRGFHTLRHSVASILASQGVDQRYIDRVLGHQTEEMRKRYQHLLPRGVKMAIEQLV